MIGYGVGREGCRRIVRRWLKNYLMNLEGNKYKNVVTFNDLQCGINKIILWLFERHKLSPRPNTIILIKVMSVTSDKHSEHDTETAWFVIYTLLQTLRHFKLHCIPWIT